MMLATVEHKTYDIDTMLENEKQTNKAESWNKLDKTVKTQVLHAYAECYGKENQLSVAEIKTLKQFFSECLKTNKLSKAKDVKYDKETRTITGVPALTNTNNRYTLRNMDTKRVNTLKSLTPIRTSIKNKIDTELEESQVSGL
jgi:hypothetical protein